MTATNPIKQNISSILHPFYNLDTYSHTVQNVAGTVTHTHAGLVTFFLWKKRRRNAVVGLTWKTQLYILLTACIPVLNKLKTWTSVW
jgi:predicted phosphatase